MNRRSFRAEQIMSRYRPIAPKPSKSTISTSTAQNAGSVYYINSTSRSCKKRLVPSSKRSAVQSFSRTHIPVYDHHHHHLELKTLPLLPNTPASTSPSPCDSSTTTTTTTTTTTSTDSHSGGDPSTESLTELSLRFGDSCASRSHSRPRTGSFALSSGSSTEGSPGASYDGGNGTHSRCPEVRMFEQAYVSCREPVALTNEKAGVVWCNPAYGESVRRSEELGLPVPLYCFASGAVLWVFCRKFMSPAGLPVCGPMRPLAVRASCESLLASLKHTSC